MNTGTGKFWVAYAVVVFALAIGFIKLHSDITLLKAVRQESAALSAQIEERDKTISDLKTKAANQQNLQAVTRQPSSPGALDALSQVNDRLEQLASSQKTTLELLLWLANKAGTLESFDRRLEDHKARVASMETKLTDEQEKLDTAKRKVEQLVLTLEIPDEVAMMDASKGLDVPGLKKYWPYFEAKRQRDILERLIGLLNLKAQAEEIEFK